MIKSNGKYEAKSPRRGISGRIALIPTSFFLIEVFAFFFLSTAEVSSQDLYAENFFQQQGYAAQDLDKLDLWPLAFGAIWALLLTALVRMLPGRASAVGYGLAYFLFLAYAVVQTGYFLLFLEMMWISDFRYASEGSDYFSVLLNYPPGWWVSIVLLVALGIVTIWLYPRPKKGLSRRLLSAAIAGLAMAGALLLPKGVFAHDKKVKYAGTDYGRAQSAEAAYENMFNAHRLYQVCGIFQTAVKDIYENYLYPITPDYRRQQQDAHAEIEAYFAEREDPGSNAMTGLLKDKNVILVLMESMDDWMIGEHTPTLQRLMGEGIHFTRFYTPGYGGVRTFNTEFCINTGSFLSSAGGYAFDYVTNTFDQSLASLLTQQGYSAMAFHYNSPAFYSRGVFSTAMGYEEYVSYQDYVEEKSAKLYDDQLLFDNAVLNSTFFREGKTLNFVITRSAHLSYKYNEVLSHWGLEKYPEYKGLTGNEETDCAYLKARLVDDFFARMLQELEQQGRLENTVIIGVTDHYTYGYKDVGNMLALSGVEDTLLLEKTPCFIWSADLEAMEVDKVLNTTDLLPTMLNLLDVESPYSYIGHDAFDENYEGFAPFANGSWVSADAAYNASSKKLLSVGGETKDVPAEVRAQLGAAVQRFVRINNLILETDYYREEAE